MKILLIILGSIVMFQSPAFAQHHGGGGGGSMGERDHESRSSNTLDRKQNQSRERKQSQTAPKQPQAIHERPAQSSPKQQRPMKSIPTQSHRDNFPNAPQRQSKNGVRQSVPVHSDSIGNRVTSDHLNRVQNATHRTDSVMHNNTRVRETVYRSNTRFVNYYRPRLESRTTFVNHYYGSHPIIIHPEFVPYWHTHHFYGGFYYGFHPVANIEVYFYNPMVYWMYVPTYDAYYYRTWYAEHYEAYPALRYPFQYHGIYYPTENLKQLLIGVSAMSVDKQVQFRAAITEFTKKIAQTLADEKHKRVKLSTGDIVVNHYEILGYDEAIVLEGSVGADGDEAQFKGILDLQSPKKTSVFIPQELNATPSENEIKTLDQINEQIQSVEGNKSAEPLEEETPATPAEISADPSK